MKLPMLLGLLALGGAAMCGSLAALALAAPPPAPVAAPAPSAPADGWPFVPLLAMGAVALLLLQRREEKAGDHKVAMRQAAHAPAPTAHILHWHPPEPARLPPPPIVSGPELAALPAALPGLLTLSDLLAQGWTPARDRVLLGLGPGGVRYEVPADDHLCHVLTVGRTGHGKSSFNRLLLPQLIALGFDVYLLDCDYTPLDPKSGEEWAPLAARTAPGRAIFEPAEIMATIVDAGAEVERRHLLRRAGLPMGTPRFYAIEEGPEVVSRYPDFMDQAAKVLRRGRRVEIYLLFIAQSALIKVIGGNSGDRGQFGTLAYVGGEPVSARAIFEEKGLPEPSGRGLARLRCFGQPGSVEARIPYGDNRGIERLLARFPAASANQYGASAGQFVPTEPASAPPNWSRATVIPFPNRGAAPPEPAPADPGELVSDLGELRIEGRRNPIPAEFIAQVRELYEQGMGSTAILKDLNQGKTGGDMAAQVGVIFNALVQQDRAELARLRQSKY